MATMSAQAIIANTRLNNSALADCANEPWNTPLQLC
jgi:hypothetical protein